MIRFMKDLLVAEEGATMVEYALMVALIGAALVGVVQVLSTAVSTKFTSVAGSLK